MDAAWLERYFKAWARHAQATDPKTGADDMARLLSFLSPEIRYEDVPTAQTFVGAQGMREMGAQALAMAADLNFTFVSGVADKTHFAFENECRGTAGNGKAFLLRAVAIGRIGPDGKVISHKDYWDLAGYMRQMGTLSA